MFFVEDAQMSNELPPSRGAVLYEPDADYSEIDLVDILSSLWKRKLMIAVAVFICVACSLASLLVTPRA